MQILGRLAAVYLTAVISSLECDGLLLVFFVLSEREEIINQGEEKKGIMGQVKRTNISLDFELKEKINN